LKLAVALSEAIANRIEAGIATAGDLALAARALRAAGAGQPVLALMAAAARVRRDDALIELWRVRFADASPYAAARAIAVLLSRYEATTWRHDRLRASPPDSRQLEFETLSCGPAPAWRTIFELLQRAPGRLQSDAMKVVPHDDPSECNPSS